MGVPRPLPLLSRLNLRKLRQRRGCQAAVEASSRNGGQLIQISRVFPAARSRSRERKRATLSAAFFARLNALDSFRLVVFPFAQSGTKDVAERGARTRRAISRHGLFLFGDFTRLDRER